MSKLKLGKIKPKVNDKLLGELANSYIDTKSPVEFINKLKLGQFDDLFSEDNLLFPSNSIELNEFNNLDNDFDCGKTLYEDLSNLSLQEANDSKLWVYLSTYVYRTYCLRKIMRYDKGKRSWKTYNEDTIINNLFFERQGAGVNARNYISRLWWSIHMTVDETIKDDKYKYSKLIHENSQVLQDLTQRKEIFKNRDLVKVILEIIFEEKIVDLNVTDTANFISKTILNNHLVSFSLNGMDKDNLKDLIIDSLKIIDN